MAPSSPPNQTTRCWSAKPGQRSSPAVVPFFLLVPIWSPTTTNWVAGWPPTTAAAGPLPDRPPHGASGPAAHRRAGFVDRVLSVGLQPVVSGELGGTAEKDGYRTASDLLDENPEITATFAVNDTVALGPLAAVRTRGRSVPADISLIGYDNSPLAQSRYQEITSIDDRASWSVRPPARRYSPGSTIRRWSRSATARADAGGPSHRGISGRLNYSDVSGSAGGSPSRALAGRMSFHGELVLPHHRSFACWSSWLGFTIDTQA